MLVTRVTNVVGARPAVRSAQLRVVDGPDRGVEIDLPSVGVVIGTERSCDVVLTDPFVSRRHCSIASAPNAQGFTVTDLGSKNGTVIDGVAVQKLTATPVRSQTLSQRSRFRSRLNPVWQRRAQIPVPGSN